MIETLAVPVFARVPSEQVTVPPDCEQLPWDGVAELNVTPAGNVSVSVMPVALDGPELATPTVYVSCWPCVTGSGESVLVTARSADGDVTVVEAAAPLLEVFGSPVSEVTFAWFVIEPWAWGVTLIETLALPAFARVPSEQVTVPPDCEQLPCEGVAELYVTPAGSVSVTVTPAALEGPVLLTPRV